MRPTDSAALLLVVGLSACTAETRFRRTALVPAAHPIPWDGRTAPRGSLRIEGSVVRTDVAPELAPGSSVDVDVGPTGAIRSIARNDTLVLVPRLTAQGAVLIAPTRYLEVGLRGSVGFNEGATASGVGTLPIPGDPDLWGVGPELRLAFELGKSPFALGFAASWLFEQVPAAEWEIDGSCAPGPRCQQGYALGHSETITTPVFAASFVPSVRLPWEDSGHLFLLAGAHQTYRNDGRSDIPGGSLVESDGMTGLLGAGYGLAVGVLRASVLAAWPTAGPHDAVDHEGPVISLTVGAAPRVFGGDPPPKHRVVAPPATE